MNIQGNSFWREIPPVVKNLLIINVLMWLATVVLNKAGVVDLYDVLGLHYFAASQFMPFQLISYMFMHGGFEHVFFNMFTLYIFGRSLEQYWGPKRFLIFYCITGIGAGLVQEAVWWFQMNPFVQEVAQLIAQGVPTGGVRLPDGTVTHTVQGLLDFKQLVLNGMVTVGASGSIFGLLLAFGMLFPNVQLMLLFFPVPIKAKYFVILYGIFELFAGVRSVGGATNDNVAHFAHLGGMLFGIILILLWKKKGRNLSGGPMGF